MALRSLLRLRTTISFLISKEQEEREHRYLVLREVGEVEGIEMCCENELSRCIRVEGVDEVRECHVANRGRSSERCLRSSRISSFRKGYIIRG